MGQTCTTLKADVHDPPSKCMQMSNINTCSWIELVHKSVPGPELFSDPSWLSDQTRVIVESHVSYAS